MNQYQEDILKDIAEYCVMSELTGSRVICNPAPTDTDQDVVVLCKDEDYMIGLLNFLCEEDFDIGGSDIFDIDVSNRVLSEYDGFVSLKKDDLNIICTMNKEFYDRFVLATDMAKSLNLLEKSDRIALFQKVLYHDKTENKEDWEGAAT